MPRIVVVDDPLPGRVGGHGMELADRIRAAGQAQREGGHVELVGVAVDAQTELEHALDGDAAGIEQRARHAPHEVRLEALVAGRDRRVDREHTVAPDGGPGVVDRHLAGDVLAGTLGEQERGMALVQVPDRRREPQLPDRPDPADAEDELLVEAHLAPAYVQDVGDRAVGLGVLRQVRVEQEDGDAPDLCQPDRDMEVAAGQFDLHHQGPARRVLDPTEGQSAQVVVRVVVFLVAVGIDRLAEVALAIEQPDADRGQGHVAGCLHVVAGEDPEPARVDPERFVEAVFGAEVGDRALQRLAVAALEPVPGAIGHVVVEVGQDVVVFGQETRVIEEARPIGRAADDGDRVPVARPRRAVHGAEQRAGSRVPRPVEVVGEASKTFEPGREREARSRLRGDADGVHEAASYPVAQRVNRFSCSV